MSAVTDHEKTGLGNYFVANYPPFSVWKPDHLPAAHAALNAAPSPGVPLGLYLHIPFCRKRCKFCYFRVYTDKSATDVALYSDALVKEVELYARQPCIDGRPLDYVYFGGGTPSYLSATQLRALMERLRALLPWDRAREVTFECEPGTLQLHKLQTLHELGVTRLSLGVENFKPEILQFNGRAHLETEIYRAYDWARDVGFEQINIDLISGMVGETWDNWRDCVRKTAAMAPESITIYQMELPFNTVFSKELKLVGVDEPGLAIADWPTKRAWVQYAVDELMANGYEQSSAYTLVKRQPQGGKAQFVYRDALWRGADMFGTGVASFGHVGGVHLQNVDRWEDYLSALLERNELPLGRALPVSAHQRMIREAVLQLKTGRLDSDYFRRKFDVELMDEFAEPFAELEQRGILTRRADGVDLTPEGYLVIDKNLPAMFEPEHRGVRYA